MARKRWEGQARFNKAVATAEAFPVWHCPAACPMAQVSCPVGAGMCRDDLSHHGQCMFIARAVVVDKGMTARH